MARRCLKRPERVERGQAQWRRVFKVIFSIHYADKTSFAALQLKHYKIVCIHVFAQHFWRIAMKVNVSKTNQDLAYFQQRLDEIHMLGHERLKAKARFAQAEAVADALFGAAHAIARLFNRLTSKPAHPSARNAPSAG
jgi:hypothetical protein